MIYVTPVADVAHWTHNTMEQCRIQARLIDIGASISTSQNLVTIGDEEIELACTFTDNRTWVDRGSLVLVTMRDARRRALPRACPGIRPHSSAGIRSR